MNILVANHSLKKVGGTETYTFALINEVKRLGLNVEYFTFNRGEISDRIEGELNVKFMSKKNYDLILANHNTTVKSLWKYGYIIQTCHGVFPKLEQPSKLADAHVAISQEVQDHLFKLGYYSSLILNGIDCERFSPKKSLNSKLRSVLSLCHSDEAHAMVEEACNYSGIEFKKIDKYKDNVWNIEEFINKVDLVIGLGRSVYDAMACGRPVIIFDKRSYVEIAFSDGYLSDAFQTFKSLESNCSGRAMKKRYEMKDLVCDFNKYESKDGLMLREFATNYLNIKTQVQRYLFFAETGKKNMAKQSYFNLSRLLRGLVYFKNY